MERSIWPLPIATENNYHTCNSFIKVYYFSSSVMMSWFQRVRLFIIENCSSTGELAQHKAILITEFPMELSPKRKYSNLQTAVFQIFL